MGTVIIGGGIIGLSTAYYLSKLQQEHNSEARATTIHIVDSAPTLLLSASGYAGGFLAKDWFGRDLASLGELSFRLHQELAQQNDGYRKWGYVASTAYSLSIDGRGVGGQRRKKQINGSNWLGDGASRAEVSGQSHNQGLSSKIAKQDQDDHSQMEMLRDDGTPAWVTTQQGGTLEVISSKGGCAQVEPKALCEWLINQCKDNGVKFHLGCSTQQLSKDETGQVNALIVHNGSEEHRLDCTNIVLAAGAWTPKVFQTLFPQSKTKIPISPLAGYSIVVRSPRFSKPIIDPANHDKDDANAMCHSIFSTPGPDWTYAPEAISRISETGEPEIYVAGLNDSNMTLPPDATGIDLMRDEDRAKDLRHTTVLLTGLADEGSDLVDDDLEIVRQGLCFRPVSDYGRPIVTKLRPKQLERALSIDDDSQVYVAAGHGPWGISLGPGTGLVVAEILLGLNTSADTSSLGLK